MIATDSNESGTHLAAEIIGDVLRETSLLHVSVGAFLGEEPEAERLGSEGSDGSVVDDQAEF